MSETSVQQPHLSIASDSRVEAALIKSLLDEDFENVATQVGSPGATEPLRMDQPSVLLLAFKELSKSEHYYLSMYRSGNVSTLQPHRTIVLCSKEEARAAYLLCQSGLFDNYVVFWPITHDPKRLLMAAHRAVHELELTSDGRPTTMEFAAQARRVAELEALLSAQLREGREHIASTGRAVEQAELGISTALRTLPDRPAVSRNCEQAIAPHWQAINKSLLPLTAWADNVMQAVSSQLESARELGALAGKLRLTVMVVDDNEAQRTIVGDILVAEGYEPLLAASGRDALSALRRVVPALMILDFRIPDIDGLEVVRQLKAEPRLAAIPVIMVTGNAERSFILNGRKLGVTDFIVKPFNRSTLMAKVARVMNQR